MDIDIKAQLEFLQELQSVDIHLREIEDGLSAIPDQIEEAKKEWLKSSHLLTSLEGEKAQAEKEKKDIETGLEDNAVHLKDREAKLYAIKTNKEYQAALKEIADGRRVNKEKEDRVIKLMEKIDEIGKNITQLSGETADKELAFKNEEEELNKNKAALEAELEERTRAVDIVKEKIDKELLDKYNFIRTRYYDPMAGVIKGICQGCNMNIPPQMYIELMRNLKVHFCPHCHRFIYAAEAKEEAVNNDEA